MELKEILKLQKEIGKAYWNLNYDGFLKILNTNDCEWSREMWDHFKLLSLYINRFDASTLAKIVNYENHEKS